ncbi:Sulfatase N-terminal [Trinorchestia longiramus]|nr:Sulfatase N-terminal [Trinorchestia longiramus]
MLCVTVTCLESKTKESLSKPNVLLIIVDDLGIGDVGCFGNDTINTPAIDKLCREGVKLTQHLAAATLCTPSRAALMTARYPQRYGLTGSANAPPVVLHIASRVTLPRSEPTIGKAFSAAGYNTHYAGKWHLGSGCKLFGRNCNSLMENGFNSTFWLPFTLHDPCEGGYSFWVMPLEAVGMTKHYKGFTNGPRLPHCLPLPLRFPTGPCRRTSSYVTPLLVAQVASGYTGTPLLSLPASLRRQQRKTQVHQPTL